MRSRLILVSFLLLCSPLLADPPPPQARISATVPSPLPDPQTLGVKLKRYDAGAYIIYTDLPPDDAREAVLRMTRMAEEYKAGTRALFSRPIPHPLPFYLFSKPADYYKASNRPVLPDLDEAGAANIGSRTWRVVQHEGFHQYADAAGRADMPTWINEGLAEYFSQSLFTGDGMVSGLIPASRLRIVQDGIKNADFKPFPQFLRISHESWNLSLTHARYDQAWSMVHFLLHAENGKYQPALAQAILLSSQRLATDRAWTTTFGTVEVFEDKWKDYWMKLPETPTLDRYAQAVVSTFAAYLSRAGVQGQTFADFDALLNTDPTGLKIAEADWLPPRLFDQTRRLCAQLRDQGAVFTLRPGATITCTLLNTSQLKSGAILKKN